MDACDALAEAWASIDGHLEDYRRGRDEPGADDGGHFAGYMFEAGELLRRLDARGYTIVPTEGR